MEKFGTFAWILCSTKTLSIFLFRVSKSLQRAQSKCAVDSTFSVRRVRSNTKHELDERSVGFRMWLLQTFFQLWSDTCVYHISCFRRLWCEACKIENV